MANLHLLAFMCIFCCQLIKAQSDFALNDFEERNFDEGAVQDLINDEEEEERSLGENAINQEEERNFEDGLAEAFQEEMTRSLQEENDEEARNLETDDDEMNLREFIQEEKERQISADFDVTRPNEESTRQVRDGGRPVTPLRLGQLIIRPVLTKRCVKSGNLSIRSHCAKYLSCGSKMFRGAIRTCESGQLFDVGTGKCEQANLVNCMIV